MKTTKQRVVIVVVFLLVFQGIVPGADCYAKAAEFWPESEPFSLPPGKAGTEYEYQFRSEGGLAPLTWRIIEGELPVGLKLESSGKLHGVPTVPQQSAYRFVVEISDSSHMPQKVAQPVLLLIQAASLRIITRPAILKI